MCYKCEICNEELWYRDEVVVLDCNGEDSLDEEHGGSGDIYGVICVTCYDTHNETIIENVSKYGRVEPIIQ